MEGGNHLMKILMNKENITGLILAGGAGSRIGGADKGFLKYADLTLIEHQIQWLKPQVKTLLISANRNISQYQNFSYSVLEDNNDGFEGPLWGLKKGLENCVTDWLFVQPIDMPDLPTNLIGLLAENILLSEVSQESDCFYLISDQREHYLSMLINRKCLLALQRFLNTGNKRVRDFHRQIGSLTVDLKIKETNFKNLNFQSDYQ